MALYSGSITFLTSSEYGLVAGSARRTLTKDQTDSTAKGFIPVDFVGLNTVVREPLTASENFLGRPVDVPMFDDDGGTPPGAAAKVGDDSGAPGYYVPVYNLVGPGGVGHMGAGGVSGGPGIAFSDPTLFNALMLHRNGPYQHPSWKQIRGGEHPVARRLRLHNTMSVDRNAPDARKRESARAVERSRVQNLTNVDLGKEYGPSEEPSLSIDSETTQPAAYNSTQHFYEPSVSVQHKPFLYQLQAVNIVGQPGGSEAMVARTTLGNQMLFFENDEFNKLMKIIGNNGISGTQKLENFRVSNRKYLNLILAARQYGGTNFLYTQTIFPKSINTFRVFKNKRPKYEEVAGTGHNGYDRAINRSFWRNVTPDLAQNIDSNGTTRIRTDGTALNSQEIVQTTYDTRFYIHSDVIQYTAAYGHVADQQLVANLDPGIMVRPDGHVAHQNSNQVYLENGVIPAAGLDTTTGSAGVRSSVTLFVTGGWTKESAHGEWFDIWGGLGAGRIRTVKFDKTFRAGDALGGTSGVLTTVPATSGGVGCLVGLDDLTDGDDAALAQRICDAVHLMAMEATASLGTTTGSPDKTTFTISGPRSTAILGTAATYNSQSILLTSSTDTIYAEDGSREGFFQGGIGAGVNASNVPYDPGFAFVEHETYQPYPISLLSMWPLDPRPDLFAGSHNTTTGIYTPLKYSTSSIGGQGMQIGLTPHRMLEFSKADNTYAERGNSVFTESFVTDTTEFSGGGLLLESGDYLLYQFAGAASTYRLKYSATGAYGQLQRLQTGSAGELVYSTKPTMFYHRSTYTTRSTVLPNDAEPFHIAPDDAVAIKGYRSQTASMQYNRHAFPYNTPFYATQEIRQRGPFFNSYSDYSENLDIIGREYTIVPEYLAEENLDYLFSLPFALNDRVYNLVPARSWWENPDGEEGATSHLFMKFVRAGLDVWEPKGKPLNIHYYKSPYPNGFVGGNTIESVQANYLSLEGADQTSSATITRYEEISDADTKKIFTFDPNTQTTSESTLSKAQLLWSQNSSSVLFYEKFAHPDGLVQFANIMEYFESGESTIPLNIEFSVEAVKKPRPRGKFYVVDKTIEIGNRFKKFIYGNLDTPASAQAVRDAIQEERDKGVYKHELKNTYEDGQHGWNTQDDLRPGALQCFLEPYFAPGLLYNSIKSGVAVDFPVFRYMPAYHAPMTFMSGVLNPTGNFGIGDEAYLDVTMFNGDNKNQYDAVNDRYMFGHLTKSAHHDDRFTKHVTSTFNYGGFQMCGASRCIPAILNSGHPTRMPFEALYNLNYLDQFSGEGHYLYLTADFLDLDISSPVSASRAEQAKLVGIQQSYHHPGYAQIPTGPRARLKKKPSSITGDLNKQLYEASINNFLCETMNFYLEDQENLPGVKLPHIVSGLDPGEYNLASGKEYYMEVALEMGKNQVLCEGPRNAGLGAGQNEYNAFTFPGMNFSMRGYLFGPPSEIVQMSGSVTEDGTAIDIDPLTGEETFRTEPYVRSPFISTSEATSWGHHPRFRLDGSPGGDYESYFAANLQDPAYQAYTPSYFYGNSSCLVGFTTPAVPALSFAAVAASSSAQSVYFEQYDVGPGLEHLCRHWPGTSSIVNTRPTSGRMKADAQLDISIINRMPIEMKIFNRSTDGTSGGGLDPTEAPYKMHYISPKWVCPVLDFSSSYSTYIKDRYTKENGEKHKTIGFMTNSFHDTTTGRGLWGGYGTDPYGPEIASVNKYVTNLHGSNVQLKDPAEIAKYDKGVRLVLRHPSRVNDPSDSQMAFNTTVGSVGNLDGFYTTRDDEFADPKKFAPLSLELKFLNDANDEKSVNVGRIANSKTVSEAMVIIPYLEKGIHLFSRVGDTPMLDDLYSTREVIPGKHFLPIHEELFNNLLSVNLTKAVFTAPNPTTSDEWLVKKSQFMGYQSLKELELAKQTDVYKMIDLIQGEESEGRHGYEMPPQFNPVHFPIKPFQMIIVPISHTFNKEELIDMYQNVMPDSSLKAEIVRQNVKIKTSMFFPAGTNPSWMPCINPDAGQVQRSDSIVGAVSGLPGAVTLGGMQPHTFLHPSFLLAKTKFAEFINEDVSSMPYKTSKEFYQNLKFMVFKVKERGLKNYSAYKQRQHERVAYAKAAGAFPEGAEFGARIMKDSALKNFKTYSEIIGYNWPYDNISLFENVKIDLSVEVIK